MLQHVVSVLTPVLKHSVDDGVVQVPAALFRHVTGPAIWSHIAGESLPERSPSVSPNSVDGLRLGGGGASEAGGDLGFMRSASEVDKSLAVFTPSQVIG